MILWGAGARESSGTRFFSWGCRGSSASHAICRHEGRGGGRRGPKHLEEKGSRKAPLTHAPQETPGLGFSREPKPLCVCRRMWLVSLPFSPSPLQYVISTCDAMKVFAQAAPGPPTSSRFSCHVLSQSCCSESEKGTERAAISRHKLRCTTTRAQNQPARLTKQVRRGICFTGYGQSPSVLASV